MGLCLLSPSLVAAGAQDFRSLPNDHPQRVPETQPLSRLVAPSFRVPFCGGPLTPDSLISVVYGHLFLPSSLAAVVQL